jgi:hypothetical protein
VREEHFDGDYRRPASRSVLLTRLAVPPGEIRILALAIAVSLLLGVWLLTGALPSKVGGAACSLAMVTLPQIVVALLRGACNDRTCVEIQGDALSIRRLPWPRWRWSWTGPRQAIAHVDCVERESATAVEARLVGGATVCLLTTGTREQAHFIARFIEEQLGP